MNLFRSFRPLNLILVALTQYILYRIWVLPSFHLEQIQPRLEGYWFLLFIVVTIIITAGGYLINDYFDIEIDRVNEVSKNVKTTTLKRTYVAVSVIGLILSALIAHKIKAWHLLTIYPLIVSLLFFYSKKLKIEGLIGNIIVALCTGLVTSIILVAEPDIYHSTSGVLYTTKLFILAFSLFAVAINFAREIVKDIEDLDGDRSHGSKSIPIVYGISTAKRIQYITLLLTFSGVLLWSILIILPVDSRLFYFNLLFILAPIGLTAFKLFKAENKTDFHAISVFYKRILLFGIISLFLSSQTLIS